MNPVSPLPSQAKDPAAERAQVILKNLAEARLLPLLESIGERFEVRLDDVLGSRRLGSVVRARHAFWFEIKARGKSYPEIGELCDVDHKTVHHGVQRHRERLAKEAPCATNVP